MMRTTLRIFTGVLAAMVVGGCASAEQYLQLQGPTAQLLGVELKDASLYGATLVFNVEVENHYAFGLPLVSFTYGLTSQGQQFLSGASQVQMIVPAGGSRTVALPARIDYIKTLRTLRNLRPGAKIPYEAELNLMVSRRYLGELSLPLVKSGEIVLPELPGVDLQSILGAAKTE